jgi:hypothetical protein
VKTIRLEESRVPRRGIDHIDSRRIFESLGHYAGLLHAGHVERPAENFAIVFTNKFTGSFQQQTGCPGIVLAFKEPEISHPLTMEPMMPSPDMSHDSTHRSALAPHDERLGNAIAEKGIVLVQVTPEDYVRWPHPR